MNEFNQYITGGSSGDKDFAVSAFLDSRGSADPTSGTEFLIQIDVSDQPVTYNGLDSGGSASLSATGI